MTLLFLASLPLFSQGVLLQPTIADCLGWAHSDLAKLPVESRPYIRYVGLWHLKTVEEKIEATAALTGIANGMSRMRYPQPLLMVPGSVGNVLRLDLRHYKWERSVWDRLADPHTTIPTGEYWQGGVWPKDGHNYPPGRYVTQGKASRQLAPWASSTASQATEMSLWTGSPIPMVNGGWLAHEFLTCEDGSGNLKNPSYYDFLGVKNEADFQRAGGVSVELSEAYPSVLREAVGTSGVTRKARAFVFLGTVAPSWYYKTLDFKDNKGNRNPLEVYGKDIEKNAQASEQIIGLPNGMQAYGLFDLTKKDHPVVDRAPDSVAGSRSLPGNFLAVLNPISCIDCHKERGLRPISGWINDLITPPLDLYGPDHDKNLQLRGEYIESELVAALELGRVRHERAVGLVTKMAGWEMTYERWSATAVAMFTDYEKPRTLETSAAYLGSPVKNWYSALDQRLAQIRGTGSLSKLVKKDGTVPYDIFEDQIEECHLVLRGTIKK